MSDWINQIDQAIDEADAKKGADSGARGEGHERLVAQRQESRQHIEDVVRPAIEELSAYLRTQKRKKVSSAVGWEEGHTRDNWACRLIYEGSEIAFDVGLLGGINVKTKIPPSTSADVYQPFELPRGKVEELLSEFVAAAANASATSRQW